MPDPVKKNESVKQQRKTARKARSYSSTVRDAQAAATRARIVDAATRLFLEDGYARTTVKAIAGAAEVAPDTVYATFGSKVRVLTAVIDARLAPGGEANVTERPETAAIQSETDRRRQIRLFALDIVEVLGRVGPVFEILRTAAAVEPDAAAVYTEMNGYRLANMRRMAGWLAANGPLKIDVDRAAETLWVIAGPDSARLLMEGRGWSPSQFAAWLEEVLVAALLPDDA